MKKLKKSATVWEARVFKPNGRRSWTRRFDSEPDALAWAKRYQPSYCAVVRKLPEQKLWGGHRRLDPDERRKIVDDHRKRLRARFCLDAVGAVKAAQKEHAGNPKLRRFEATIRVDALGSRKLKAVCVIKAGLVVEPIRGFPMFMIEADGAGPTFEVALANLRNAVRSLEQRQRK